MGDERRVCPICFKPFRVYISSRRLMCSPCESLIGEHSSHGA